MGAKFINLLPEVMDISNLKRSLNFWLSLSVHFTVLQSTWDGDRALAKTKSIKPIYTLFLLLHPILSLIIYYIIYILYFSFYF